MSTLDEQNYQPTAKVLDESIAIVGAGVAGLITAHVLLQDGFTDVTIITRDKSVGGTWARQRVYPGLFINNVHGEYRFSNLDMPPPAKSTALGGRLSGLDLCEYMEKFSRTFLEGKAKIMLETEVLDIRRRGKEESGWEVDVKDVNVGLNTLQFSRIVLASGGCSRPKIPEQLSSKAADLAGYKGLVIHSSQFANQLENILALVKPSNNKSLEEPETVVVVGAGRSGTDIGAKLTLEGRNVVVVYERADVYIASKKPRPDAIRKSRLLGIIAGHHTLNTRLERFLHTTSVGSKIARSIWQKIEDDSYNAFNITKSSPLRRTQPLFWGVRTSDEGNYRPDSFFALTNTGKISVASPARAVGYDDDGKSLLLSDGRKIKPKVVVLCTGYTSSWENIFSQNVASELGIDRHAPETQFTNLWKYKTLQDAPELKEENEKWVTSIHRGLVPAKNIERRDFAIAGSTYSANPGYTNELAAHWIASYFRGDKMRLPSSAKEAIIQAEERAHWMKVRFPSMLSWANESYSGSLDFWTWIQAADELLEDMYLPSMRSGGNWFNWAFKTIEIDEISNLKEERRQKRDA